MNLHSPAPNRTLSDDADRVGSAKVKCVQTFRPGLFCSVPDSQVKIQHSNALQTMQARAGLQPRTN